jgi:hypothetical protein
MCAWGLEKVAVPLSDAGLVRKIRHGGHLNRNS